MKSASQHLGSSGIMSNVNNKDDDEDELEALRLAALESLRAKGLPPPVSVVPPGPPPNLNVPPPQPVLPPNHVYKRHQGNQNLIAIVPVEQSPAVHPTLYQKPPPPVGGPPSLLDLQLPPPPLNLHSRHNRPPSHKDRPSVKPVFERPPPPTTTEEKAKVPTKFSRFEDSDSEEEEDDVDVSVAKSDNEEEEIVVEAADADDIVIEIVDEDVADDEEAVDEIVLEEHDELTAEISESVGTPSEPTLAPDSSPIVKSDSEVKTRHTQYASTRKRSASPLRKSDSPKDVKLSRDSKTESSSRLTEDSSNRSPKHGIRSPRRRSPVKSQRSPVRSKRSPARRSPTRSQRSPPRPQRSPPSRNRSPVRSHRSPLRSQRSPARTHRSPMRSHRSPPRSPLRSRSPQQRSQRSPARTQANKSTLSKYNDKEKSRTENSKPVSVAERLGSSDSRRVSEQSKTSQSSSSEVSQRDQRRTKEKSPVGDKKILVRRSPPSQRSGSSEKEAQKPSASLSDSERLELRKRKFEMPVALEAKKDGKIRLRTEDLPTSPPEEKTQTSQAVPVKVRKEELSPPTEKSKAEEPSNGKRSSRSSKEEKRQNRSARVEREEEPAETVKLAGVKSKDSISDQSDLRAELQRRRNNRCEDDEPRSRTPETRRILVLNSPTTAPASVIQLPSSKSSAEPANGVPSKQKRSLESQIKSQSAAESSAVDSKRSDRVSKKRSLLSSSIEMDKGRETDPLEDRIRHIRAQNELIRKRQMEIEADKLQYA